MRKREGEGGGVEEENGETKVASPRLTSLFKCLFCRSENSFSSFEVEFGIDRGEKKSARVPWRYRYQEEAWGFFNGFKCSSILAENKQER